MLRLPVAEVRVEQSSRDCSWRLGLWNVLELLVIWLVLELAQ